MLSEEDLPERTPPIVEIGPAFLGTGNIPKGIELPTGAIWTPLLWVFGDYWTALNYFDNGTGHLDTIIKIELVIALAHRSRSC